MLILDLDDTIFLTSSMDPKIFGSALKVIESYNQEESTLNTESLINELWSEPIDSVFDHYSIPKEIKNEFYREISRINYTELKIEPFNDYSEIRKYKMDKILVTTGLSELQNAKIDALDIRNDFAKIFIDDPRIKPRNTKFKIFQEILKSTNKSPDQIWVIGDNPNSEIEAAYKLGLNTIQRKSITKIKSKMTKYYISNFNELDKILN